MADPEEEKPAEEKPPEVSYVWFRPTAFFRTKLMLLPSSKLSILPPVRLHDIWSSLLPTKATAVGPLFSALSTLLWVTNRA